MADNIILNSGTGGATLAAKDISSIMHQRILLVDASGSDISPGRPLHTLHSKEYFTEVVKGTIPNTVAISKFGRNSDIDTLDAPEDIWEGGSRYTGHPTGSVETVTVFSSDSNDASGLTGMNSIRIFGLQSSGDVSESSEDIILNGATGVVSANNWYRVYRAYGLKFGSDEFNRGQVTVRHTTTTGNVFCQVPSGYGQSQILAYTIPHLATGYIVASNIRMSRANGAAGSATVSVRIREFDSGGYRAAEVYEITDSQAVLLNDTVPTILPALSDVKVRVDSVSDNNTVITAELGIIVELSGVS